MRPDNVYFLTKPSTAAQVAPSDITVCIAIRLSDINPWVVERLKCLKDNYLPKPRYLILDFGSSETYANIIRSVCEQIEAQYYHIDDFGEFSLAAARNFAFQYVQTDFIFFTDIDFIYERGFFGQLADICNRFEIRQYPLRCFTMPAFHVSKAESRLYESLSAEKRDRLVSEWSLYGAYTEFGVTFEFVAPYSNNFLCHRNLFSKVGGYCTEFRGHGSEDFEFFIRLAVITNHIPMPNHINKDLYSPLNESFFKVKDYAGFRRLMELFSYPSESIGLKSFHIWHPRPSEKGYWTTEKDLYRGKLNKILSQYIKNAENILELDFLSRPQKALCILEDEKQWRYFLPLRLAGYRLSFVVNKNSVLDGLVNRIKSDKFNRIFIFCHDLKELYRYNAIIELARSMNIQVYFADPETISTSICFSSKAVSNPPSDDMKTSAKDNQKINNLRAFASGEAEQIDSVLIENLILDGQRIQCGLGKLRYPFSWRSYVSGHLTLSPANAKNKAQPYHIDREHRLRRKLRKFIRSPKQFIRDALIKRLL